MARTRTRSQIRDSARQLADQAGTQRNTDASLNYQIDQFAADLHAILVQADPDRFLATTDINTTSGTKAYALPADFMAVRRVARVVGNDEWTIHKFPLAEKDWFQDYPGFDTASTVRYRVWGQGHDGTEVMINFEPNPETHTYRVYYVQAPELFADDNDTYDGVSGWESWIEHRLAIWMKERDEEDTSGLRADLAQIERRIAILASQRDAGKAPRVSDIRRSFRRRWRVAR